MTKDETALFQRALLEAIVVHARAIRGLGSEQAALENLTALRVNYALHGCAISKRDDPPDGFLDVTDWNCLDCAIRYGLPAGHAWVPIWMEDVIHYTCHRCNSLSCPEKRIKS